MLSTQVRALLMAVWLGGLALVSGPAAFAQQVIDKVEDQSFRGEAYIRLTGLSYAQCEERCLRDPQCVAMEHYRGGGTLRRSPSCSLFSTVGETVASTTSVIGYKKQSTAGTAIKRGIGSAERSFQPTQPKLSGAPSPVAEAAPPPAPVAPARPVTRGLTAAPGADKSFSASASDDFHIVPVFYGTNREQAKGGKRIGYSSDRAKRLEMGQALVSVPLNHQVPNIERPRAWNIPFWGRVEFESEDPKRHFTVRNIRTLNKADMIAEIKKRLGASDTFKGQSIVFIHGYNVGFDDALYRTAQISFDLQFDGAAFTYSWPSGGGLASYVYDRDSAQGAEPYLYEFLQMVQNETGTSNINIIAHSMGNQMLLQVLRSLKLRAPAVSKINQIVLAAPDVDRDAFEVLAREITGIAKGITLYAASNDRALDASRVVAGNQFRAGDVSSDGPVIVAGIDSIDITSLTTGYLSLGHSGYAERTELLTDLSKLFRTGQRPPERRIPAFHRVTTKAGGVYWRYTK